MLKGRYFVASDLNNQSATKTVAKPKPSASTPVVGDKSDTDDVPVPTPLVNSIINRANNARQFIGNSNDTERKGQRQETIIGRFLGVDFNARMVVDPKTGLKSPKLHPVTQEPMVTAILKVGVFNRGTLEIFCPKTFWDKNITKVQSLVTLPVIHVKAGDIIGDPANPKGQEPATMDGIGLNGSINQCEIMEYYSDLDAKIDAMETDKGKPLPTIRAMAVKFLQMDMERLNKAPDVKLEDELVM